MAGFKFVQLTWHLGCSTWSWLILNVVYVNLLRTRFVHARVTLIRKIGLFLDRIDSRLKFLESRKFDFLPLIFYMLSAFFNLASGISNYYSALVLIWHGICKIFLRYLENSDRFIKSIFAWLLLLSILLRERREQYYTWTYRNIILLPVYFVSIYCVYLSRFILYRFKAKKQITLKK